MSLGPGTRIGPYEVLSMIGAGGMGEAYRARDTKLVGQSLREKLEDGPQRASARRLLKSPVVNHGSVKNLP
jgi:hypothetical protein